MRFYVNLDRSWAMFNICCNCRCWSFQCPYLISPLWWWVFLEICPQSLHLAAFSAVTHCYCTGTLLVSGKERGGKVLWCCRLLARRNMTSPLINAFQIQKLVEPVLKWSHLHWGQNGVCPCRCIKEKWNSTLPKEFIALLRNQQKTPANSHYQVCSCHLWIFLFLWLSYPDPNKEITRQPIN